MSCFPEAAARPSRRACLGIAAAFLGKLGRAEDLRQLKPSDEAGRDPGLAALLGRIRGFVEAHSAAGLEGLMAPTFRVEFDVGKGPRAFHMFWHPESASSRLWPILARLFALGGTFYSETLFALPYVYTRFPFDLGLAEHVVLLKPEVSLLEQPGAGTKRVTPPDYSILPLKLPLDPPVLLADGGHLEVSLPGTGSCFVANADVYSPAAHRAFFEKRQGQWRWISLAAATRKDPPMPKGSVGG
jgi:hypothetical protein